MGDYSMRDLSRETNGAGWPSCYGDSNLPNGDFFYGFLPRTIEDLHPGYDKDVVKQTMIEHEGIFKKQVYELHRLYRVQRDLMDEVKRKEQYKRRIPYETSSSSSPLPAQMQSDDAQRWNGSNFALASPVSGRPLISGPDTVQSSPNSGKGKGVQTVPSPYQNCYSPRNSEVSESRPSKLRKPTLDLRLPADEYIDTDEVEQCGRTKDFEIISLSPDKNRKHVSGNGKMVLGYPGKTEYQGNGPNSDLHFSKPKALADLNEPLHVEETTTFSSSGFLGRASNHSDVSYRDNPTRLLNSSKEIVQNSKRSSINGMNNIPDIRGNGQDWFHYALEAEHYKAGVRSINQGINHEKVPVPSQPVHILLDQACQPPTILSSHASSHPGLFQPSDLGKSWDHSATSWGKPNSLTQKPASIQTTSAFHGSINLGKSPLSSAPSNNDMFANKWNLNNTPGGEPPVRNGFYQGSSAALKELSARFPPAGFDYVNCKNENTVPCHSNNVIKSTRSVDVKEMNLNVALSNGVCNEYIDPRRIEIIDEDCKPKDPLSALPWLKGKGVCNNEAASSRKGLNSLESVLSQGRSVAASSSCVADTKAKKPESSTKILGVPIFDSPPGINHRTGREEIESSKRKTFFDMNVPCEASDSDLDKMSVDEVVVLDKKETKSVSLMKHFDLNSCITEEENPCETSMLYNHASVKVDTGIDLETPATPENEDVILPVEDSFVKEPDMQNDGTRQCGDDELIKCAAAAIVAFSSCANSTQVSTEGSTCPSVEAEGDDDPLNWFVSIACSSGNDPEIPTDENDVLPEGLDDFEYIILKLKECTVEEYFPKPSIPEFSMVENSTCALTTRPRRGPGRRGRQRRDFQRDILPGLTTLSRHEVTEDLQTFGGLMRATGYSWHSGPNRRNATRNGRGRGRRRSIVETPVVTDTVCALPPLKQHQTEQESEHVQVQVQVQMQVHSNSMEVGLEDRSLRGWGKTTRRPRRQRCPAGNPVIPVPLT
ncbi:hypothetical protein RND81_07G179100 [Saponaria officinalis]